MIDLESQTNNSLPTNPSLLPQTEHTFSIKTIMFQNLFFKQSRKLEVSISNNLCCLVFPVFKFSDGIALFYHIIQRFNELKCFCHLLKSSWVSRWRFLSSVFPQFGSVFFGLSSALPHVYLDDELLKFDFFKYFTVLALIIRF